LRFDPRAIVQYLCLPKAIPVFALIAHVRMEGERERESRERRDRQKKRRQRERERKRERATHRFGKTITDAGDENENICECFLNNNKEVYVWWICLCMLCMRCMVYVCVVGMFVCVCMCVGGTCPVKLRAQRQKIIKIRPGKIFPCKIIFKKEIEEKHLR